MGNVSHIKSKAKSSMDLAITEMLEVLLDDIKAGRCKATKAIVCLLEEDHEAGTYNNGFRMTQLSSSQAISLIEITKFDHQMVMRGFEVWE